MIKTGFLRFDELYLPNIHIPTLYVFDVRTECVCIPTGVLYYGFTKYMYGVTLDTLQIVHEKRNQLCYFAQKIWSCVKLGMVSSSSSSFLRLVLHDTMTYVPRFDGAYIRHFDDNTFRYLSGINNKLRQAFNRQLWYLKRKATHNGTRDYADIFTLIENVLKPFFAVAYVYGTFYCYLLFRYSY